MTQIAQNKTTNGLATISKETVTKTKQLAAAVREATLSTWFSTMALNDQSSTLFTPWVEMTRQAHELWLDMYETQAHNAIDQTMTMLDKVNRR